MSSRSNAHVILAAAALAAVSPLARAGGTVDGQLAANEYAFTLGVQDTPTGFGDNQSELNAAFADVLSDGSVRLMLTGNLETNGNGLVIFFDNRAGGGIATTLPGGFGQFGSVGGAKTDDWGTDIDGGTTVNPPPGGPSVLSPGFNPELSFELNAGGATNDYYINLIDLTVPNEPGPNRDVFLGQNVYGLPAVSQTYFREPNADAAGTVTHAFDNSNTAGVIAYDFTTPPGPLGDPLSATKGFEASLDALFVNQDPLTEIKILPFITNGGGDFLSNQFLPGLAGAANLGGPGAPGGTPLFDTREFPNPNTRYLTIPLPTISASGVWGIDSNWNTQHAPNGPNTSAVITGGGGGIEVLNPITVGGIGFRTANSYILAGPSTITLDTLPTWQGVARSARLEATAGTHTISAAMNWNQNVVASVAAGSTLSVTSDVTVAAGKGLTKTGDGTFGMKNLRMSFVNIQGGTVRVNQGATSGEPARASKVTTFSIVGGSAAPAARLDLTNNAIIISQTAPVGTPIDDVKAYVTAAYAGGAWTGNGIGSSLGNANQFAVGYATPAQIGAGATYLGQSVSPDDAIARTTRYGDANLDGLVNLSDFNRLAANFGSTNAVWSQGDFNFNGSVNLQDFNLLAGNFGQAAAGTTLTPQDWSNLAAAVPEPASLSLVALGALPLLRRRRVAQ